MLFFGKPDTWALAKAKNVRGLIKALRYKKDEYVRARAAEALGELGGSAATEALVLRLTEDDESYVKSCAARALDKLGWVPADQGPAAASFWRGKGDFAKCAACGPHGIAPLLELVVEGHGEATAAYPATGRQGLEVLMAGAASVAMQYQSIASGTSEISFASDGGRHKAAVIEKIGERLGNLAQAIGRFNSPAAEACLSTLYHHVRKNIYSHPESGFLDMFGAVKVRESIIDALWDTAGSEEVRHGVSGPEAVSLLSYAIESDPAAFVRWHAADVVRSMAKMGRDAVKCKQLQRALATLVSDMQNPSGSNAEHFSSGSGRLRLTGYIALLDQLRA